MDNTTAQAFADFERFLMGQSAPALVGHALATVVRYDIRAIAETVMQKAYTAPPPERAKAILVLRAKVYDIFFYRIVRFRRVYDFFPRFEKAFIEAAPVGDRPAVTELFRRYPWQEIRPIGEMRDPQEFALEVRPQAAVTPEQFNEDLYRSATHQILSADKRFRFTDEAVRENVVQYQAQVNEVFDDFVSLIKDALMRREIMLANVADRDIVYQHQQQFQIEGYLGQLADLAIALFNDDFLEHSVQIFGIIRTLADASNLDVTRIDRFQSKSDLLSLERLAEYGGRRTGPILLRSMLPMFPQWRAEALLDRLMHETDRHEREIALTVFAAYGKDVYSLVVESLERADASSPWAYRSGLVWMLGHIATDATPMKVRAARVLAQHLRRDSPQQLNAEIVAALAKLRSDEAVSVLTSKLGQFEPEFGKAPDATDACNRIVNALLEIQTEASARAAVDFCFAHNLLDAYRESFTRTMLPEGVRTAIEGDVRKEMKKLKMSFSLLGNTQATRSKLLALGSAAIPDVGALCDEVAAAFPPTHDLGMAIARLREAPAPPPALSYDRALHALLEDRNLPEALSLAFEAGTSGRLEISTRAGIAGEVNLRKGEVWHASVPTLFSKDGDAFFWIFALERSSISMWSFDPARAATDARTLDQPTPDLIREGLFRAKHVQQIIGGILSPESRFRRSQAEFPGDGIQTTGQLGPYRAVWVCLTHFVDLKTIAGATGLSDHEIYRVLFDLLRQNLLIVETGTVDPQLATLDDAVTALELFVRRIQQHPTYFQSYQSAAEICAYLSSEAKDDSIRTSTLALHTFILNGFNLRRVFTDQNVEFLTRVVALMAAYLRSGADIDRQELLDYLDIYLPEEDRWPQPAQDEDRFIQSILEQIENIDGLIDPYDVMSGVGGVPSADVVTETLEDALEGQLGGDLASIDIRLPRELLSDSAGEFVKPIKDFVREIERNNATDRETSSAWLKVVATPVALFREASARSGEAELAGIASRLEQAFARQQQTGSDVLTPAFCGFVLGEYAKLAAELPAAFSLEPDADHVAAKREALIVKFVLRQVPEVDDRVVNKVLLAGFATIGDIAETAPDDLARSSSISRTLADKIFMKVFQYEEMYFRPKEPSAEAKFRAYFAICLNVVKEIQGEVQRLAVEGNVTKERKEKLYADRQRALWGLFALLCLRGQLDEIERLQRAVFEQRIVMLEEYYTNLTAEPFPTGRRRA